MADQTSFSTAYALLIEDFQEFLEYVHPVDPNESTYSHRSYELLLRSCTEFESACKFGLRKHNLSSPQGRHENVNDYKQLESVLKLESLKAGALFWMPQRKILHPFLNWTNNSPPLDWYQDYNKVKHNRESEFACASLKNVVLSLSANFLLLYSLFGEGVFSPYRVSPTSGGTSSPGYSERRFDGSIFTVIK